jgi:hypothetical protein
VAWQTGHWWSPPIGRSLMSGLDDSSRRSFKEFQVVDEWILSDDTILVHIFILDLHL